MEDPKQLFFISVNREIPTEIYYEGRKVNETRRSEWKHSGQSSPPPVGLV